nr:hypothetical protein OH826_19400 [Streptomyces sp. NBC_00899]
MDDQLPPSPQALTGGPRPMALCLMRDSHPAPGDDGRRGTDTQNREFELV